MGEVIESLKAGRFNEAATAKMLAGDSNAQVQQMVEEMSSHLEILKKENARL